MPKRSKEPVRIVGGIPVLTEAQIAGLSDQALDRYRRIVLAEQQLAHDAVTRFHCDACREVAFRVPASESEAQRICTFDYAAAASSRERDRRLRCVRSEKVRRPARLGPAGCAALETTSSSDNSEGDAREEVTRYAARPRSRSQLGPPRGDWRLVGHVEEEHDPLPSNLYRLAPGALTRPSTRSSPSTRSCGWSTRRCGTVAGPMRCRRCTPSWRPRAARP